MLDTVLDTVRHCVRQCVCTQQRLIHATATEQMFVENSHKTELQPARATEHVQAAVVMWWYCHEHFENGVTTADSFPIFLRRRVMERGFLDFPQSFK